MQLKQHQLDTVSFCHATNGRVLITSDPGTGKTACASTYLREAKHYPALIVCPATVKGTWKKELLQWAGIEAYIVDGKSGEIPSGYSAYIINGDILRSHQSNLAKLPLKMMVLDECHFFSNRAAARTKAAMMLARRVTHVLAMSGTPISNRPADFWPVLHMLYPGKFPSFSAFAWKYCDPRRTHWGWDYSGSSNLEQLHEEIKSFTIGFKKAQVLNLPKRTVRVETVPIVAREEYDEAEKDFLKWLSRHKADKVAKARKAEAVTKTSYILLLAAALKTKAVIKWLQDYLAQDPVRKVIVFCTHTKMRELLCERVYPDGTVFIDGSVPSSKRHAIVERFQSDPSIRLFVGNCQAAGTGITLTAACTTVFAELPWTPAAIKQGGDRNHRIGQDKETNLIFLVAAGTIEEKIARRIQEKQDIADLILDGSKQRELPLMDLLGDLV